MHLVEIFLPLQDNDGNAFPAETYSDIRRELTERFGGVTSFSRAPAHGTFRDEGGVAHDDILIYEVMTEDLEESWWRSYREGLEKTFRQDEILIRASAIKKL